MYLIGIDEAGRGPIAGPVAIGVLAVRSPQALDYFNGIRDSKKLTHKEREAWFVRIKKAVDEGSLTYSVSYAQSQTIDAKGIVEAVQSAINRSLRKLEKHLRFEPAACHVLLDGCLRAPRNYINQETIIGGDDKEAIIALASICAKVLRDRRMVRLAKKFPGYGFERHKGYATRGHYRALKKLGMTEVHRRSYL